MSGSQTYCNWIAVDWGTSNLRAWAMSTDGAIIAETRSDKGMGSLSKDAFEPALLDLVGDWLGADTTPVLACGMVGSRQGWHEAPYLSVPCPPYSQAVSVPTGDSRISMHILPGLKQEAPPDVMRGEETQIAGFLAKNPEFDGVLCLPGTHSKWVRISAGEVISFQSFMTGEVFGLLKSQSVLRHSIDPDCSEGFEEAVAETLSKPEILAAKLFQIRAADLVHGVPKGQGNGRLSGLLIGAELAASRPYWLGQNVALIGAPSLTERYAKALATQGVPAEETDGATIALQGLTAAYLELVS